MPRSHSSLVSLYIIGFGVSDQALLGRANIVEFRV